MYDELVKRLRSHNGWALNKTLDEAADVIEELSRLHEAQRQNLITLMNDDPEMEWIPVTERPPKKTGSYLVYVYGEVTEMNYWRGEWHRMGDDYTKAVTHWMPLPRPPVEE